jgi:hypothetical protein
MQAGSDLSERLGAWDVRLLKIAGETRLLGNNETILEP